MDDAEAAYIVDAIEFVAALGHRFLPLYEFDPGTGLWSHREHRDAEETLSIEAALDARASGPSELPLEQRQSLYRDYLVEARALAEQLGEPGAGNVPSVVEQFGELRFFHVS